MNMEKIYSEEQTERLFKVNGETIKFLLDFSKSVNVSDYKGVEFDSIMN